MNYNFQDFLADAITASKTIHINNINDVPDTQKIVDNISRLQSYLYDVKERYSGEEKIRIEKIRFHYEKAVDSCQNLLMAKMVNRHELPYYLVSNYNDAIKDLHHWLEVEKRYLIISTKKPLETRRFLVAQNGDINVIPKGENNELRFENEHCHL